MDIRSMSTLWNPRDAIASRTLGLFAHADYPLKNSLDFRGDPGLFGPGSATWEVVGDLSVMVGGIRALLVQAAHPEVVAGVSEHSSYGRDPLGRLSRTASYVAATSYGAMPEVEQAFAEIRRAHRPVTGISHRGIEYSADSGSGASWVHNVLADSFLSAFEVFGPHMLTSERADQFAREQAELGALLHATELPDTRDSLALWVDSHPGVAPSPGMDETITFLASPPLPAAARAPYQVLLRAAAATLPPRIAGVLGFRSYPGAITVGRSLVSLLRWSIGSSSSWWLALERVGVETPEGVRLRYPPPIDGIDSVFTAN
jgi:uncharacterized protein (DUF2236 family)